MQVLKPYPAIDTDLCRFHADDYVAFLKEITLETTQDQLKLLKRFNVGDDCPVFDGLYQFYQKCAGARELLGCLAVLGIILKLPPAVLGLTVLAWGNSVRDLVADVAAAKAGQPAMDMAGCYAGPMFNMLIGFGLAPVIRTAHTYPPGYYLHFHVSIVVIRKLPCYIAMKSHCELFHASF
ncbi:hypothetical protein SUGI_0551180 [Cryptomeria japonica]|nr:hypothetical protein SUGI_0551180 [Cryptomeria japonica]